MAIDYSGPRCILLMVGINGRYFTTSLILQAKKDMNFGSFGLKLLGLCEGVFKMVIAVVSYGQAKQTRSSVLRDRVTNKYQRRYK